MSILDDLKRVIHPDSEDYEDDGEFDENTGEHKPIFNNVSSRKEDVRSSEDKKNNVLNIHATAALKVVLVKPERFEDASMIADHLREKRAVVMNLESTNKEVARRLIDFLSGVAYATEGKIKKVAVGTYIVTPYSVDIMGDLLDELGNTGLYM